MDLAIAVVYLVGDDDEPLLDLHLGMITEHTRVPYAIYAAAPRLQARFRSKLESRPEVRVCECTPTSLRGGPENSHYLTQLVDRAVADGATHVVLMHVDSFPIRSGWETELAARLEPNRALAAVTLAEVGQDIRPNTSCLFVPRRFYEQHGPVLCLSDLPRTTREYRAYRRQLAGADESGDAYGYLLHARGLGWHRMVRSNAANDHHVMAGIYDDLVFHLGGAARRRKSYRPKAEPGSARQQLTVAHRVARRLIPLRARLAIPERARRLWNPEGVAQVAEARHTFEQIRARLLGDPDGYVHYLRTGERD